VLIVDDTRAGAETDGLEIVNPIGRRRITWAIHDIDGTHSLIRDWQPVMSRVLYEVIVGGLPPGYDDQSRVEKLSQRVGSEELPETDRFCVESAGLSALSQMEWAIRRGIETGTIEIPGRKLAPGERAANAAMIAGIWKGCERSRGDDAPGLTVFLTEHAPRLFLFYEKVLNCTSRDRNLASARRVPEPWRVRGSLAFLSALHVAGVKNIFVTGAVVDDHATTGIREEVMALGYDIGPERTVEEIRGSQWDRKMPKAEVLSSLCLERELDPEELLIVGDGRAEIQAGTAMGAVTVSRLPGDAERARQIHRTLGTNYIISEYRSEELALIMPGITRHWSAAGE